MVMRFLAYLNEDYLGAMIGLKWGRVMGEVFINPSAKEIQYANNKSNSVRFVADFKRKKLFVWTGGVVHYEAAEWLKKEGHLYLDDLTNWRFWDWYFAGTGEAVGGKIKYVDCSDFLYHYDYQPEEWGWVENNADTKWLDQYFTKPFKETAMKNVMAIVQSWNKHIPT